MTTILKRIFKRKENNPNEVFVEDDKIPDGPYILSSVFYLSIFVFIGLPMWFYTCTVTRYPLPDLTKLENKLFDESNLKLHLDISIIQLSKDPQLTDYLRENLPIQFGTSLENVTYNIGWRVRRPTQIESELFKHYQKQQQNFSTKSLINFEKKLLEIHNSSNRFRLFVYIIEKAYHKTYCDPASSGYTINFERFVYLCTPIKDYQNVILSVREVLEEIYSDTVSMKNSKNILGSKLDLLFSILPEVSSESHELTSNLADKIHSIYNNNVKAKFPQLNELVNIRLLTHNIYDLFNSKQISDKIFINNGNSNETIRNMAVDKISKIFHNFESRISKSSSQYIQNVLVVLTDSKQPPVVFNKKSAHYVNIIEGDDLNFMLLANSNDDKSLVLGIRSLIRKIIGLKSVNLCKNCLVRRDVFFNPWEIDAIMSALTITKLHRTFQSLNSIRQQVIGVKIPKEVAELASEANSFALSSLEHLETNQPLESYRFANRAYQMSETAYFDPSLLESLYFPDDLKHGIYMPLFLPMAIALIWSVYGIINFYLCKRKKLKIN